MKKYLIILIVLLSQVILPNLLQAKKYLTKDEALKISFPEADNFTQQTIWFDEGEIREIEKKANLKFSEKRITLNVAQKGKEVIGFALIDNAFGKKEFITYMLALETEGSIRQVEILEFRESQGYEIENKKWRDQFKGKKIDDPIQLKKDIVNISGATLSSQAITKGIRKLLTVFEVGVKMKSGR